MKGFSERNPIVIAVIGLVTIAAVATATFYADDLPIIGGGTTYTANFTDASGLKSGDDVRIAGVKVGKVDSIGLYRRHVRVRFKSKGAWIGDQSTAAIKIKTLLGQEYIDIDPLGSHGLSASNPIPLRRTTTPLDVSAALSGLSSTVGSIDTTQLATSFDTLSAAFQDAPADIHSSLVGLSRLSRTISSRDAQLTKLAGNTQQLTASLADSNKQFAALINDGALLLQELEERSSAITDLLDGTRSLATQLSGLVHDDNAILGPALTQLSKVTTILTANQGNLKEALRLIGPYYTLLNNATGSGHWVDIYICGLFDRNDQPQLDANAKRNCAPKAGPKK
jgi:phospholipid/cholesterol/gamma-HCH transport system substrate-binding protein